MTTSSSAPARFTVVVPAYNVAVFVTAALDSVARQTFTDYDVVVVDNGSTDDTGARVREWASGHPRCSLQVHRREAPGTIGASRNAGLRLATGEFIAFLDADDLWTEQKLARVVEHLARYPDLDLVCHDEWLLEGTAPRGLLRHGPYTRYEEMLFKGNTLSTSATVVRRMHLLAVGGLCEDAGIAEDYDLWLRLARAGARFAYLHEVLGYYRVHGDGVTTRAVEHCQDVLNVLDAHFRALPSPTIFQRLLMRRRRAATLRGAVQMLLRQGRHAEAWRVLGRAVREDPMAWKTWVLGALSLARASR